MSLVITTKSKYFFLSYRISTKKFWQRLFALFNVMFFLFYFLNIYYKYMKKGLWLMTWVKCIEHVIILKIGFKFELSFLDITKINIILLKCTVGVYSYILYSVLHYKATKQTGLWIIHSLSYTHLPIALPLFLRHFSFSTFILNGAVSKKNPYSLDSIISTRFCIFLMDYLFILI